jgi:hypothetical protein
MDAELKVVREDSAVFPSSLRQLCGSAMNKEVPRRGRSEREQHWVSSPQNDGRPERAHAASRPRTASAGLARVRAAQLHRPTQPSANSSANVNVFVPLGCTVL